MPLYLWIGNPFCFPCIPLRLLVVFPGGLIAMVMTFGPVMGVTKNRLLRFAPEGKFDNSYCKKKAKVNNIVD